MTNRATHKYVMRKVKLPGPHFKITSGIYLITCSETKDCYVGKSKNLNQRWCQHRHDLKAGTHNNPGLQALYDLYGPKSFTMELLELVEDESTLETREVFWIELKKPSLNVADTRLSESAAEDIKNMIASGASDEEIMSKYNLTRKYLLEIKRGDKWKQVFKNN